MIKTAVEKKYGGGPHWNVVVGEGFQVKSSANKAVFFLCARTYVCIPMYVFNY